MVGAPNGENVLDVIPMATARQPQRLWHRPSSRAQLCRSMQTTWGRRDSVQWRASNVQSKWYTAGEPQHSLADMAAGMQPCVVQQQEPLPAMQPNLSSGQQDHLQPRLNGALVPPAVLTAWIAAADGPASLVSLLKQHQAAISSAHIVLAFQVLLQLHLHGQNGSKTHQQRPHRIWQPKGLAAAANQLLRLARQHADAFSAKQRRSILSAVVRLQLRPGPKWYAAMLQPNQQLDVSSSHGGCEAHLIKNTPPTLSQGQQHHCFTTNEAITGIAASVARNNLPVMQGKELTQLIRSAASPSELKTIIDACWPAVSAVHVAAALQQLAFVTRQHQKQLRALKLIDFDTTQQCIKRQDRHHKQQVYYWAQKQVVHMLGVKLLDHAVYLAATETTTVPEAAAAVLGFSERKAACVVQQQPPSVASTAVTAVEVATVLRYAAELQLQLPNAGALLLLLQQALPTASQLRASGLVNLLQGANCFVQQQEEEQQQQPKQQLQGQQRPVNLQQRQQQQAGSGHALALQQYAQQPQQVQQVMQVHVQQQDQQVLGNSKSIAGLHPSAEMQLLKQRQLLLLREQRQLEHESALQRQMTAGQQQQQQQLGVQQHAAGLLRTLLVRWCQNMATSSFKQGSLAGWQLAKLVQSFNAVGLAPPVHVLQELLFAAGISSTTSSSCQDSSRNVDSNLLDVRQQHCMWQQQAPHVQCQQQQHSPIVSAQDAAAILQELALLLEQQGQQKQVQLGSSVVQLAASDTLTNYGNGQQSTACSSVGRSAEYQLQLVVQASLVPLLQAVVSNAGAAVAGTQGAAVSARLQALCLALGAVARLVTALNTAATVHEAMAPIGISRVDSTGAQYQFDSHHNHRAAKDAQLPLLRQLMDTLLVTIKLSGWSHAQQRLQHSHQKSQQQQQHQHQHQPAVATKRQVRGQSGVADRRLSTGAAAAYSAVCTMHQAVQLRKQLVWRCLQLGPEHVDAFQQHISRHYFTGWLRGMAVELAPQLAGCSSAIVTQLLLLLEDQYIAMPKPWLAACEAWILHHVMALLPSSGHYNGPKMAEADAANAAGRVVHAWAVVVHVHEQLIRTGKPYMSMHTAASAAMSAAAAEGQQPTAVQSQSYRCSAETVNRLCAALQGHLIHMCPATVAGTAWAVGVLSAGEPADAVWLQHLWPAVAAATAAGTGGTVHRVQAKAAHIGILAAAAAANTPSSQEQGTIGSNTSIARSSAGNVLIRVSGLRAESVVQLLQSFVLMRVRPPLHIVMQLLNVVSHESGRYKASQLLGVLLALVQLRLRPPAGWMQRVLLRLQGKLRVLSFDELTQLCWSLAHLRVKPPQAWQDDCVDTAAVHVIAWRRCHQQHQQPSRQQQQWQQSSCSMTHYLTANQAEIAAADRRVAANTGASGQHLGSGSEQLHYWQLRVMHWAVVMCWRYRPSHAIGALQHRLVRELNRAAWGRYLKHQQQQQQHQQQSVPYERLRSSKAAVPVLARPMALYQTVSQQLGRAPYQQQCSLRRQQQLRLWRHLRLVQVPQLPIASVRGAALQAVQLELQKATAEANAYGQGEKPSSRYIQRSRRRCKTASSKRWGRTSNKVAVVAAKAQIKRTYKWRSDAIWPPQWNLIKLDNADCTN